MSSGNAKRPTNASQLRSRSQMASDALEKMRRSNRAWAQREKRQPTDTWERKSWTLPREEARKTARDFFRKYPRAAYWTEVESWRVLPDDRIEFTMRRLPSAD